MIINNETILLGIIGNPIGHSLSPLMHNQTLEKLHLNCIYLPFEVSADNIGEAIVGLRALNVQGVNITIPFKQAVIPYLDELSPESEACGAVNLIKNDKGKLTGFNTDGRGFMESLKEAGISFVNQALIIGAGGAGRSLAYELCQSGVRIINILDLDKNKAIDLAAFVSRFNGVQVSGDVMSDEVFNELSRDANLIINCSPVGMHPYIEQTPINSTSQLRPDAVVYDLIYNPLQTRLLSMAHARGLKTINGLSMLVHQGALTLEILTGIKPPIAFMKEVVLNNYKR